VRDAAQHAHTLWSCVDLELHRGHDGRLYLLDAARALPPCTPAQVLLLIVCCWLLLTFDCFFVFSYHLSQYQGVRGCNLFRLFRPEFVATHTQPLCPDAYGGWPLEDRQQHEQHIDQATKILEEQVLPRLVMCVI
jgi:hypothetical protein